MATQVSQTRAGKQDDREQPLRGKVALVTGANRGIGKAIATAFARAGACSIVVARERDAARKVAEELTAQGWRADCGVADVTMGAQVTMLALDLMQTYPSIDILVNNAGIFLHEDRDMPPSNMDLLVLQRTLAVNLEGPIQVCAAFVPRMPKGGRIINVSSRMGQISGGDQDPDGPAYSISKAALNMYTAKLASELSTRGIMVDAFHPGYVKTDMSPRGTVAPEQAAETALFLATRPASEKTGLFWYGDKVIDF